MEARIGITPSNLSELAHSLNILLADENVLYIMTRNAHWNVEGADFLAMHRFFEEQYTKIELIIDDVAERIRTLGHYAVATLNNFLKLTSLSEEARDENDGKGHVKKLLRAHETIIIRLRENINRYANDWKDAGTSDFITGLMETHEKMAWMLRMHLA